MSEPWDLRRRSRSIGMDRAQETFELNVKNTRAAKADPDLYATGTSASFHFDRTSYCPDPGIGHFPTIPPCPGFDAGLAVFFGPSVRIDGVKDPASTPNTAQNVRILDLGPPPTFRVLS